MNRTGLLIALAIAVVVGLVFGLYPGLDLEVARYFHAFEDRSHNMFALRIFPPLMKARDIGLRVGTILVVPAVCALIIAWAIIRYGNAPCPFRQPSRDRRGYGAGTVRSRQHRRGQLANCFAVSCFTHAESAQKQTAATSSSWLVHGHLRRIVPRSKRIWLEGAEKFVTPLYSLVTIAGDCMEAFDVGGHCRYWIKVKTTRRWSVRYEVEGSRTAGRRDQYASGPDWARWSNLRNLA